MRPHVRRLPPDLQSCGRQRVLLGAGRVPAAAAARGPARRHPCGALARGARGGWRRLHPGVARVGMPLSLTIAAATHGMAFGLWPICWIVVSAVFFYNLSVESGDFDVIRRSLSRLTGDRRVQLLLVAFCFC